jgi:VWFA-related protein
VSNSQPPQASSGISTIREYSNLVVVDVVVDDPQGDPVHGLSKEAFAITENGKAQTIRHFEEHSAAPVSDTKVVPPPKMPPGLFSNRTPAVANGTVNVLLLDYLNTPVNAQPYARKQLLDYLDKAPAGTRIAIFTLNTQLSMLQGFTSDTSVLKTVLTSKEGAPGVPDIQQGKDRYLDSLKASATQQEQIDAVNRAESLDASMRRDMQARYTLNAFDMLGRYLVGIPGRKNVIWFSGGFPLDVEPDAAEADPNDSVVRNDEAVRRTDNLLTRAQVAVYPVDVRGVQGDPALDFGSDVMEQRMNADIGLATTPNDSPMIAEYQAIRQENSVGTLLQGKAEEQETMMALAEDTGGQAFINTNGLTHAVQKAIENGSNYYTLTYAPTNTVWDSRFRAIKVKVDQPGVKLNYRNGYYAVDPNDRNKVYAQQAAAMQTQPTTMVTAMLHGGPEATEILFKVRIRPASTPPEETPLKSNQANPDPKVKVEGPFKSYGVDLVPDPHAVNCKPEPNGNRHCQLEIWTFVYNADGQKLITASNRVRTMLTPTDYQRLLTGGMAFHQEISVPVKGQYFIRTAIHDLVSDRVGAVEVPVAAVVGLDPLKQVAAAPAPPN